METEHIDTDTEYAPPRRFWKDLFVCVGGALITWFIFFSGQQIPVLWFRVVAYVLSAFLALCTVLALYHIVFYKAPYVLNRKGVFIQGLGLVPWSSIERVTHEEYYGHRRTQSTYSVYFDLRDFSFLNTLDISPHRKKQIEKKRRVRVPLERVMEGSVIDQWAAACCTDLKYTKDIEKGLFWEETERQYTPPFAPPPPKETYPVRYLVDGVSVIDPHNLLSEEPRALLLQMNAVVEQIVDLLASGEYETLCSDFFNSAWVEPDDIRQEIEKAKVDGRLKSIFPYDKNARAKVVVTNLKLYNYFYDLCHPEDVLRLSLSLLFRLERDSGQLRVLRPGSEMLTDDEVFTDE